ncbi:DUF433 domain-containing protein [Sulfobacillus thermosulfidooxidans]|uniref:DUF433 domain-containing protein n=1 Tax=Sulfobacillus thermosulfidooxidans TaxID=28034 RepID=UPI0014943FD5|nr:DUF433 domain-containing protein [Sulfobacillus thermosulfidooxidans]
MARDHAIQQGHQVIADALSHRIEGALREKRRQVTLLAPHIAQDPAVLGGTPVLLNTRLPAWIILARLAAGETLANIQQDFPYVTQNDIRDVLQVAANVLRGDDV